MDLYSDLQTRVRKLEIRMNERCNGEGDENFEIILQFAYSQKRYKFEVKANDLVEEVKEKIAIIVGIPAWKLLLIMENHITLEDARALSFYAIKEGTTLQYIARSSFEIFVHSSNEEVVSLQVKSLNTIEDVKEMIKQQKGISMHQKCLFFNFKHMQDDQTLSDCKIQRNSLVHLVPRLRN